MSNDPDYEATQKERRAKRQEAMKTVKMDSFDLARIAFNADNVWILCSKPTGMTGPITPLGMFPSMRVAHHYLNFVREHNADEEFVGNCDLGVVQYRRSKDGQEWRR